MKIKNLFSSGKMNKDIDERLIQDGQYIDALNVRVVNTSGSDAGALENEKGNVLLTNVDVGTGAITIGSVADESDEKLYWCVVNDLGHSYIFEYDEEKGVTTTILQDERVGGNQVLNFSKDYKITGINVVYNKSKKTKLLLISDGFNQPRMIDIQRAKSYGLNGFEEDDISLYKKPPRFAPSITPFNTAFTNENAVKENFFSFAFRYRYLDGGYSAASAFTYFQFTPKDFSIDYTAMENEGMENIFNGYRISYNSGDKRVTDVQLLFKYSTDPVIFVIDSINKKESSILDNTTQTYEFSNKKIYKTLPSDEFARIYDDVPLTAKTQDIIEDRVVFGNTTSQYDVSAEEGGETIEIDYSAALVTTPQQGTDAQGTLAAIDTVILFDLSDFELKAGSTITFRLMLNSDSAGTSPNEYFNGFADIQRSVFLLNTYTSISLFVNSSEFTELLEALSSTFSNAANTTTPPDASDISYGSFTLDSSSATSFSLLAPIVTHTVDNTPADPNDNDFSDILEQYKFIDGSKATFRNEINNMSLKSNRSYEVGLCYLDKYGRYSSVLLPRETFGQSNSEIFVPIANSVNINSLSVTLKNNPPYWADRYKFFVKVNKALHYNLYATIFYEEQVYRWVLLQGANIGKVEEGQNLIVKSDDNGPLSSEVKCKVLEITTKTAADEFTDGEGWIEGNDDVSGNPVIEKAGTYMKIRPNGFKMDYTPNDFIDYNRSTTLGQGIGNTLSGTHFHVLPYTQSNELGILQIYEGNAYVDQVLNSGSTINLKLVYSESDGSPSFKYEKDFIVNQKYEHTSTRNALAQWFDNETIYVKQILSFRGDADAERYIIPAQDDDDHEFRVTFYRDPSGSNVDMWSMDIRTDEGTALFENSTLKSVLKMQLQNKLIIFETDPVDFDEDIYYETEECFEVIGGYHQGNTQNQDASNDAICSLDFGNCFSFGNGAESVRIRDDRFRKELNIKSRPNISIIEGYERKIDTNKLIYSGSFNENTGYNTLNEFNSSRGITKFLDLKYGSIQGLVSKERDLIVFQEDRVSKVLYGKNILSSPDGSGSLSQIEQVLGQDIPYSGEYGVSTNPESIVNYQNNIYFTDANRGAVLRIGANGVEPISFQGMKAYFKDVLQSNRNNYNYGGYDPRNNQYVLSMSDSSLLESPDIFPCLSKFKKTFKEDEQSLQYNLLLDRAGTYSINYSVSGGLIIISSDVGGDFNSSQPIFTGTGTYTFTVSSAQALANKSAKIILSSPSTEIVGVDINHACPSSDFLDVVLLVVNDAEEFNKTITNRYKHSGANVYNSDLDVFEFDGVTRYETISGEMGSNVIPENGDTVTISSLKQINQTADFTSCNSLGYLVSDSTTLTVDDIVSQATYPSTTQITSAGEEENFTSFVFNRASTTEKLYLVYNYIDNLPVLVDDLVTNITNGSVSVVNVLSNDTVSGSYTVTIGNTPKNGTAVVNGDNTITYTHTPGQLLVDVFTYIVTVDGSCSSEATVEVTGSGSGQPSNSFKISGKRSTCSDFCDGVTNYAITLTKSTVNDHTYANVTINDVIYGDLLGAGFYAYAETSTDTFTGTFRIMELDASNVVLSILQCDESGNCVSL